MFYTIGQIEKETNIIGLLTSNKLWELLVANRLGHHINTEQKKHDAYDDEGYTYEYKVSIHPRWTFQDISKNVLDSYLKDNKIVLAVVDKIHFRVIRIYLCKPEPLIDVLMEKLNRNYSGGRLVAYIGVRDIHDLIERGDAIWLR